MNLTQPEAQMLIQILQPRAELLNELLMAQIQALPPGDASWFDTQHELRTVVSTIEKVRLLVP